MPEFTPTETKLLSVLGDGKRHRRIELQKAIDEYTSESAVKFHLSRMRKKLRPIGEDIICEFHAQRYYYRHVRLIAPYSE